LTSNPWKPAPPSPLFLQAYRATGKEPLAQRRVDRFQLVSRDNDLQVALYDPSTGGAAMAGIRPRQ